MATFCVSQFFNFSQEDKYFTLLHRENIQFLLLIVFRKRKHAAVTIEYSCESVRVYVCLYMYIYICTINYRVLVYLVHAVEGLYENSAEFGKCRKKGQRHCGPQKSNWRRFEFVPNTNTGMYVNSGIGSH